MKKKCWEVATMKIYFIRHGHPNYEKDCLTELGHLQAAAVAKRLKDSGIQKIFASDYGRAIETAEHTAKQLDLEIEKLDFIRELHWGTKTEEEIPFDGHPWFIADDMMAKGENIFDLNWTESDRFSSNILGEHVQRVSAGMDKWLETLGYEREGNFYRVVGDNTDQTIAVFSHAGSSSAALAHLLGLAFPWVLSAVRLEFTSVTVVDLSNEKGTLAFPTLTLLNDAKHLEGLETENVFGR